jgi:hypothetical protein
MRTPREEANVSDGPPVEHSIMKRAWPYALALAVVVTGCYLALTPLLRSLNPGPTATPAAALLGSSTTTVAQTKSTGFVIPGPQHGATSFASALPTATKKKTRKATKKVAVATQTPIFVQSTTPTDGGTSLNTTSTTSTTSTPARKPSTKTAASKTASLPRSVGGGINQNDNGGFAGQSNGNSSMTGGKTSSLAGG